MVSNNLPNLIKYIVSEIQDSGFVVFRTRLVKLLYLSDFSYYQTYRKDITGLSWFRYKFGPYSYELPSIMGRIGLDLGQEELDFSQKRGIKYSVTYLPDPKKWLDTHQKFYIDRVIRRWGGEDLDDLLDYVYCHTEPMINAKFNDALNFKTIKTGIRFSDNDKLVLPVESIEQINDENKAQLPIANSRTLSSFRLDSEKNFDEPKTPVIAGKKVQLLDTSGASFFKGKE